MPLEGAAPSPPSRPPRPFYRRMTMAAFAKRVVALYIQGASRYPMPFIWSL